MSDSVAYLAPRARRLPKKLRPGLQAHGIDEKHQPEGSHDAGNNQMRAHRADEQSGKQHAGNPEAKAKQIHLAQQVA
jgi:hypothetical protein